jgi:hypothetical protein
MVALNRNDIPATINTIEALSVWCSAVLTNLHFQMEIQEGTGIVEKVAVSQTFPINSNGQYQWRHVGRQSLALSPDFQMRGKIWEHAQVLSNASVPNDFKS